MSELHMELTLAEVTVDELYAELGRLREIGWGAAPIDWHTSRSHLGRKITMSLALVRDEQPKELKDNA